MKNGNVEYVIRCGKAHGREVFRSDDRELARAVYETVVAYCKDVYRNTYRVDLYELETITRPNRLGREEW